MSRRKTGVTYQDAVSALVVSTDATFLNLDDGKKIVRVPEYLLHLEREIRHAREDAKARGDRAPGVHRNSRVVETPDGGWEVVGSLGAPAFRVRPCDAPSGPFDLDEDGTVVPPRPPKPAQTDEEWLASIIR